ncbi:unnamed protein product [Protopolystoma xenopodis]|uniref:Uncharacterized protein n=1 Tax=Protopolystoma xenopodis TaxID=117903 RepID=A0A3S5AH09_9PLAT|nr:unnamed protein product [Protopolystoma xenopodis]
MASYVPKVSKAVVLISSIMTPTSLLLGLLDGGLPYARQRIHNEKIARQLHVITSRVFKVPLSERPVPVVADVASERKRCSICPQKKDRTTNSVCLQHMLNYSSLKVAGSGACTCWKKTKPMTRQPLRDGSNGDGSCELVAVVRHVGASSHSPQQKWVGLGSL